MFGRNPKPEPLSDEMRKVRDTATDESWPINDPRANYSRAEEFRQTRAEGAALALRDNTSA